MVSSLRIAFWCLSAAKIENLRKTALVSSASTVPVGNQYPIGRNSRPRIATTGSFCLAMVSTISNNSDADAKASAYFNVGQSDIAVKEEASDDALETNKHLSWRSRLQLSNAKSRAIRGTNFVQIATVDRKSNEPRCRSVVFRGFLNLPESHCYNSPCDTLPCVFKMCTDRRSDKVDETILHPNDTRVAEIVWWFSKTSEQYRIRGELVFVGGGEFTHDQDRDLADARNELWAKISESARESFICRDRPGGVYTSEAKDELSAEHTATDGDLPPPPADFLMMLLVPNRCDYLRLKGMYRQIDDRTENRWIYQRVNP